jgi:dTDP-L-rhamnose 4-epimerase
MDFAKEYFESLRQGLERLDSSEIEKVVDILVNAWKNKKQVFIIGNGGSAATASHMACDFGKGTLKKMYDPAEKRFKVLSLTDNTPLLTALANDVGYDNVFAQQLSSQIGIGDILILITGSGNSENILRAIRVAQEKKAIIIGLLGVTGGKAKDMVDYSIIYDESHYGRIEDAHMILSHLITCWIKEKTNSLKGAGGFFKEDAGEKTESKKKVLIIGGAGFIGSHTADFLVSKGYSIRILDNLEPPVHEGEWPNYVKGKNYELVKGDVANKEVLTEAIRGVDYIFHLAAYQDQMPDFSKFFRVNTVSTALIFEIIQENNFPVKKIVYASSQFVYGDGIYMSRDGKEFYPELRSEEQFKNKIWEILDSKEEVARFIPFKEEQKVNPTNSYGLSKIASENLALRLGKTYKIPVSIVRYSIVQGARQSPRNIYSGALRIFVTQALSGQPITVTEDGNQLRDFVNVEDVVRANALMIEDKRTDFEIYNVGGGNGYRIKDFAEVVKKITQSDSEILIDGRFRRTDARDSISDISKLRELGWSPIHTPEKSIQDYADWIKAEGFDIEHIAESINKGHGELT